MSIVHDAPYRASLEQRIRALRSDSPRKWGKMSVDQMLWHVNQGLSAAVGETSLEFPRPPLPRPLMKFLVLKLPWIKGAPTAPSLVASGQYDLEASEARCLRLVETLARKPLDGPPFERAFGTCPCRELSQLQAKRLDHHEAVRGLRRRLGSRAEARGLKLGFSSQLRHIPRLRLRVRSRLKNSTSRIARASRARPRSW